MIPISPTSLGTYLTCPRQFEAKYITKEVVFQPTAATIYGDRMHKAIEAYVAHGAPLGEEFAHIKGYVDQVVATPGKVLVEQKLAFNHHFIAVPWRERWAGAIGDLIVIGNKEALVIDWKSGKKKEDTMQLELLTHGVFGTYGNVQKVRAALVFFQSGDVVSMTAERRSFKTEKLLSDIARYTAAQQAANYPPKPNGLCRSWCDVVACPHNGKTTAR